MGEDDKVSNSTCEERMLSNVQTLSRIETGVNNIQAKLDQYREFQIRDKEKLDQLKIDVDRAHEAIRRTDESAKEAIAAAAEKACKANEATETKLAKHAAGHWKWVAVAIGILALAEAIGLYFSGFLKLAKSVTTGG